MANTGRHFYKVEGLESFIKAMEEMKDTKTLKQTVRRVAFPFFRKTLFPAAISKKNAMALHTNRKIPDSFGIRQAGSSRSIAWDAGVLITQGFSDGGNVPSRNVINALNSSKETVRYTKKGKRTGVVKKQPFFTDAFNEGGDGLGNNVSNAVVTYLSRICQNNGAT